MSHTSLHNFLEKGFTPYERTLDKLEAWTERSGELVAYGVEEEEITPPNYEGFGIEIPERDRLHPRPLAMFDRFVHQLIDLGLGREDIEYWGRTVLAPIAHLNTLHRGREESDATTEEEQTWIVEHNIEAALRIIARRRR